MTRVTPANPLSGLLLKEAAYLVQSNGGKPTQNTECSLMWRILCWREDICKIKWSSVAITKKQFANLNPEPEGLN